ncbi:lycopene cyclase family protein [Gordonia sp. SL306]|uniref:lycopene cyclase family protein n=1 Tax=Gordonia sp. SL306 TaxID=2995145 RepID=UPI00226F6696|nr:lycopene cyclase family protein [Gordonia sp. SL306]WAC55358.1 lycopene cyclase family protein [Gordonia sp. SL306]
MTDVVVVGAGPAGRALTHRLLQRGVEVTLVDPHPSRPWRPTYACWADEIPAWIPRDAVSAQTDSVEIRAPDAVRIERGYAVFDNPGLRRALDVDGARIVTGTAQAVADDHVITGSGTIRTGRVVDARGTTGRGPRQTAWGVVVSHERARSILRDADAVLMDWNPVTPDDGLGIASFLYAVPLDDERFLLEETCLAGDPPLSMGQLRSRLERRLGRTVVAAALETESVSFALHGTPTPWQTRPQPFGSRGGLLHPATGYSIGASLRAADVVADAVAADRDPQTALWPIQARAVYRLRSAGLRAVLGLEAEQTRRFFATFARLSVERQRAYLTGRDDLTGTLSAMAVMFAHADPATRRSLVRAVAGRRPVSDAARG